MPKGKTKKSALKSAKKALVLALWGERFIAWFIDFIVINALLLSFPEWSLISFYGYSIFSTNALVFLLYWTLMEGHNGQSIGKMALKIRVVTEEGGSNSYVQSFIQAIGKTMLLPIDLIIGLFISKKKQRLFQLVSNTIVVKK